MLDDDELIPEPVSLCHGDMLRKNKAHKKYEKIRRRRRLLIWGK